MATKKKNFSFDAAEMFVSDAVKKAHERETSPEPEVTQASAEKGSGEWVKAPAKTRQTEPKPARTQEEINRLKGASNIIDANGEKRTRRVQLLVRPSLYDQATSILELSGESFSSLIDDLLTDFVKKNRK